MLDIDTPDVLDDGELLRYARQILHDDWDLDAQIALKRSHAIIVGVGGLGCPLSQTLVRAGVGRLTLIDHDCIDASNLQRQTLFFDDNLGQNKAIIAKQSLGKHNPMTAITAIDKRLTADNIADILGNVDADTLLIDCTDNFAVRDVLNQYARQNRLALLSLSAIKEVGQIALYTEQTGCYRCVFADDDGDTQTCADSGVLASTVAIIGSLGSQLALDWLGRKQNPIANRLLLWQGKTMTLRYVSFKTDDDCPICQSATNFLK